MDDATSGFFHFRDIADITRGKILKLVQMYSIYQPLPIKTVSSHYSVSVISIILRCWMQNWFSISSTFLVTFVVIFAQHLGLNYAFSSTFGFSCKSFYPTFYIFKSSANIFGMIWIKWNIHTEFIFIYFHYVYAARSTTEHI